MTGRRIRSETRLISFRERAERQSGAKLLTYDEARRIAANIATLPHPDSMDLYFQGRACWNEGRLTESALVRARGFFEGALVRDPSNVDALVGVAFTNAMLCASYFIDKRAALLVTAEANATDALSLTAEHALAHWCLGAVQVLTNRAAQGIAECERAVALDRNLAIARATIGIAKYFLGHAEETEGHIQEALRLSPRDTNAHVWVAQAGSAKLLLGRDEEAAAWFRRAIETNRDYPTAHFYLAAALAHLNRLSDAQSATQAGLSLQPTFTISRYRAAAPSDNLTFLAQRERVYDGMRKAGVPEG